MKHDLETSCGGSCLPIPNYHCNRATVGRKKTLTRAASGIDGFRAVSPSISPLVEPTAKNSPCAVLGNLGSLYEDVNAEQQKASKSPPELCMNSLTGCGQREDTGCCSRTQNSSPSC